MPIMAADDEDSDSLRRRFDRAKCCRKRTTNTGSQVIEVDLKLDKKQKDAKMRPFRMAVIKPPMLLVAFFVSISLLLLRQKLLQTEALHVTNFRVPAYVPITLPTVASHHQQQQQQQQQQQPSGYGNQQQQRHELVDLVKPILFDCDYDYQPEEDARLTVRWFRNKEPEPFYQWLPELNERHFADWIKPLLNQSFVSDPHDPMKRYRSLLIKRLSMNLTGQYTCLVSSLGGQDMRQSSLVVYQAPRAFTFEHRVFPAPAALPSGGSDGGPTSPMNRPHQWPVPATGPPTNHQRPAGSTSPTHFKTYSAAGTIVRPPNNNLSQLQAPEASKIVYTHDGRPVLKPVLSQSSSSPKSKRQISEWMLRKRLDSASSLATNQQQQKQLFAIQLHHIQCQAVQVTPRPVIALLVKRDAESIVQYLHESSSFSIRAHQVNQADYYYSGSQAERPPSVAAASNNNNFSRIADADEDQLMLASAAVSSDRPAPMMITLYDITVSATVALNVSLLPSAPAQLLAPQPTSQRPTSGSDPLHPWPMTPAAARQDLSRQQQQQQPPQQPQMSGITTVLPFRRGQRMSFECHLEITGTDFERRERININEQEVYKFVELEQQKRRLRQQQQQQHQHQDGEKSRSLFDGGSRADLDQQHQQQQYPDGVGGEDFSCAPTFQRMTILVTTIICFITSLGLLFPI